LRSSRAVIAAALTSLVLVPALAACGSDASPSGTATTAAQATTTPNAAHKPLNKPEDLKILDGITVTGDDPAVTPKLIIAAPPVNVSATTVKVLKEGAGDESVEGNKVTVRQALFLGKDGKQLQSDYETKETPSFLLQGSDTIPGLITALTGVKAGSRVLFAIPPAEAFGPNGRSEAGIGGTDDLIVVADIVSVGKVLKQAEGAAVAPVEGQPTVTFDPTAGPTITVPKTAAPTALVVQNLVDGTGPEVKSGQTITVHYTGVLWTDGTVFDSSWTRNSPATFGIGTGNVIPGWDKGLVGKKVGSRVLLVVPPADGYGAQAQGKIPANATLVFVVDILDAS
jgi:FKBP-type peptidyl-prolyl cis-trans isomerase